MSLIDRMLGDQLDEEVIDYKPTFKASKDDEPIELEMTYRGKVVDTYMMKKYHPRPKDFLDRASIWYGKTGCGKSFHMRYILAHLAKYFPRVIVFSKTNKQNRDFADILPDACVRSKLTIKAIEELLELQETIKNVYNRANEFKYLFALFRICAKAEHRRYIDFANATVQRQIAKIRRKQNITESVKQKKIKDLQKAAHERIKKFVKKVVIKRRKYIDVKKLNEDLRFCYKYLRLNPRLLVIFEDEMDTIRKMCKKEDSRLGEFFYNGRHNNITHMYTMQYDKGMESAMRSNVRANIFVNPESLRQFCASKTNAISKQEVMVANAASEHIEMKGKKIIYLPYEPYENRFQYTCAVDPGLFHLGAKNMGLLCKRLKRKHDELTGAYAEEFVKHI